MTTRVYADMFVPPEDDTRTEPSKTGDERATLDGFLQRHRETLELKCSGLSHADLSRRMLEPSKLSLIGLIRHMADVERGWFRRCLAGQDAPPIYYSASEPDGDFDGASDDPQIVADAWQAWRDEIAFAENFVAQAPHLEVTGRMRNGDEVSLRWVLTHMVEEYARHNGHADILREQIDGAVGQ